MMANMANKAQLPSNPMMAYDSFDQDQLDIEFKNLNDKVNPLDL
jgi:hypothetical protein